jgi:hypothetical protein
VSMAGIPTTGKDGSVFSTMTCTGASSSGKPKNPAASPRIQCAGSALPLRQ